MTDHPDKADDAARDLFFGDLYFETTAELLTDRMTNAEAEVISTLLRMRGEGRCLDLGCGHGRHVEALREAGFGGVLGADRSLPYLRRAVAAQSSAGTVAQRNQEATPTGATQPNEVPFVCGDIRGLPFADEVFDCAYSWYSGLFLFDEDTNLEVLREAARVLKPGGLLLHHGANPQRLEAEPVARHQGRTRSGARVEEVASFDSTGGRERLHRRLTRPDGTVLEGSWSVRHYRPDELEELLYRAGLALEGFHDETGRAFQPAGSLDLIAVARRAATTK